MPTIREVEAAFPSSMKLPAEVRKFYVSYTPRDKNGPVIATCVWAAPHDDADIAWHAGGKRMAGALARLFVSDNQIFCIWKAGDGGQPIVCLPDAEEPWVMAENSLEFFRFLSIGYMDVVRENRDEPPKPEDAGVYRLNPEFPKWVSETFNVTIPTTGREIYDKAQSRFRATFEKYWHEHNDL